MIPEFLVILTNCISDYWVVSPPKKRSKSPSNPPIRPPKQTWPSSMGFQAPKVLKVTGYHRLQYLNSMTQCGILPIHQASKDDLSITQTTYINDISIFISYNIVHPDMWHNQLYSIHIHIYIYPNMSYYYLLYPTSVWDSPAGQLRCRCATGCWSPRPRTARSRAESGSPTLSKSGPGNEHLGSQLCGDAPAKLLQKRSSDVIYIYIYIYKSKRKPHISWDLRKI